MRMHVWIASAALLLPGCSSLPAKDGESARDSSLIQSRSLEVSTDSAYAPIEHGQPSRQTPAADFTHTAQAVPTKALAAPEPTKSSLASNQNPRDRGPHRLTYWTSTEQAGKRDCLSSADHLLQAISFKVKVKGKRDCGFPLLTPSVQLGFSYDKQAWNPSTATDSSQALMHFNEQHSLARTFGTVDLYDKLLVADFEFKHSRHSLLEGEQDSQTGLAARIGMKGALSRMTYWSEYSIKSLDFTDTLGSTSNDNASAKVGAEWIFDLFKPKLELSRFRDNLSGDPEKSQTVSSKGALSLNVDRAQWPTLNLSYAREQKETAVNPGGALSARTLLDSLRGKVSYSGSTWDAHATSSLSMTKDRLNEDSDSTAYDYTLGGAYRPITGLSFTPSSQFTQAFSEANHNRRDTLSAGLGLEYAYAPWALDLSLKGSFTTNQTSDGTEDNQSTKISLSFEKDLNEYFTLPHKDQRLILKLNHSQYEDFVNPDSDTKEFSAFLLLKISP